MNALIYRSMNSDIVIPEGSSLYLVYEIKIDTVYTDTRASSLSTGKSWRETDITGNVMIACGSSYTFDPTTGIYTLNNWSNKAAASESGFTFYAKNAYTGKSCFEISSVDFDGNTRWNSRGYWHSAISKVTETKGDFIKGIIAPTGTYPSNGKFEDYWYVIAT